MTFNPDFKVTTLLDIECLRKSQVTAIVTIECQYEVICALLHGDISNDLDGCLIAVFKVMAFMKSNISKTVHFWD